MKKLTLTAIILLCFFLSSRTQKPAEMNKSALPDRMGPVKYEEKLYIADLQFHAQVGEADHFQSGRLKIVGQLSRKPDSPEKVVITLEGGSQPILRELSITDSLFELEIPVIKPLLWSAESPYLYVLRVKLGANDGKDAEVISRPVSFRQVLLREGFLWVNGRRIWIKGINLQESDPVTGQAISREALLRDIRMMKAYHINAIRASGGADDANLYEFCDAEGLYVDTVGRMIRQDRDHPCLIPRAAGLWENELMSGNSLGGFANAWDTIRAHRANFQGGYCWNFAGPEGLFDSDGRPKPAAAELKKGYQDILTRLVAPLPHPLSTKGEAGFVKAPVIRETPAGVTIRVFNDYFFKDLSNIGLEWELLVNGIAGPKGRIAELGIAPQQSREFRLPVKMPAGAGNDLFLNIRYRLRKQELTLPAGHVLAEEQLLLQEAHPVELSVMPKGELSFKDEDGAFTISCPAAGVNLRFNKQTGWLQQYMMKGAALLDDTLGLKANFWRAPTDRDYAAGLPVQLAAWQHSTKEPKLQLFSTSTSSELVIVRADYTLPETFCNLHVRYTINALGEILADQVLELDTTQNVQGKDDTGSVSAKGPILPRFGMQWILPAGYDSIAYYGSGPQENYADRNYSAQKGIYSQTVADQFFPYARPQETGTKTNVRWWKIMDRQGKGLLITADSALLSMSALHYFDSDLDGGDSVRPRLAGELRPRPQTQLSIDRRQMGVGGIGLRGRPVLSSYGMAYANYHLTYKINPIP